MNTRTADGWSPRSSTNANAEALIANQCSAPRAASSSAVSRRRSALRERGERVLPLRGRLLVDARDDGLDDRIDGEGRRGGEDRCGRFRNRGVGGRGDDGVGHGCLVVGRCRFLGSSDRPLS